MHVILMGAQGAGKGTQAETNRPAIQFGSSLDRRSIPHGNCEMELNSACSAKQYLDRVNSSRTTSPSASSMPHCCEIAASAPSRDGALFDGFPRTAGQAAGLDSALAKRERADHRGRRNLRAARKARDAIARPTSLPELRRHLSTSSFNPPDDRWHLRPLWHALIQRTDDTPEAIERRLDIFFAETEPLLDYYQERGLLTRIDGDRPIDEVTAEIADAIKSAAAR